MKKYTFAGYVLLIGFVLLGFVPFRASAAVVYLQSSRSTVSVGDTVIISAKINAEGVTTNTVEGDIVLTSGGNNASVQEFSLANSAFGLWPRTPSLSKDGQDISFVGGVPGGFNIEGATLFNIILQAKKVGSVIISPKNMSVFANDGKGTKLPVTIKSLTINIVDKKAGVAPVDDWNTLVAGDTTPPNDFIVVPGQDPSMFGGSKFVFFSAVDNQSGISYYDVSENGAPVVRSGSTYVLQDQKGPVNLVVTAYDKAGNKKVSTYSSTANGGQGNINWLSVIVTVLVLVVLWSVYKMWKKGKKNASKQA